MGKEGRKENLEEKEILTPQEAETKEEVEGMDIGELDLDKIKKSYEEKEKGYVPKEQVTLLLQEIIKGRSMNPLGISFGPHKDNKRKHVDIAKNPGRKSNQHRIAMVAMKLVESG